MLKTQNCYIYGKQFSLLEFLIIQKHDFKKLNFSKD